MVSSFDIFDTCIVRKCGNPKNLFDVLSYRVFRGEVSTECRIEFITQRMASDDTSTYDHLYETFNYNHPLLLDKTGLKQKELACEREMAIPVMNMLKKVKQCREHGDKIIFISDMYLPTSFLKETLIELGFFKERDSIYVSGDCDCCKHDGSLYQWIKEQEHIDYANWHHYGDNPVSDVDIPSKLGITTHLINHEYLPFEADWKNWGTDLSFHTGEIMAGIGRSISLSTEENPHNAFAIDIVAPLLASFATRIMEDATKRGINRLYFCARDSYALYQVARKLGKVFPEIQVCYLYISREALYDSPAEQVMAYLIRCGMAQDKSSVGIVDMRSTGRTLSYLNSLLKRNGYNSVFGYYFEIYCSNFYVEKVPPYYCEVNRLYSDILMNHYPLFETFFSLCPEGKTIGYTDGKPIISSKPDNDYRIDDLENISKTNLTIIGKYIDSYISTELYRRSAEVFYSYVIPTLKVFFCTPPKAYVLSLRNFHVLQEDGLFIPYVEKVNKGLKYQITYLSKNSSRRCFRRVMKLIMRTLHIQPIHDPWWIEGSIALNTQR